MTAPGNAVTSACGTSRFTRAAVSAMSGRMRYRADFDDRIGFAERYVGEPLAGLRVRYRPYDWRVSSSSR